MRLSSLLRPSTLLVVVPLLLPVVASAASSVQRPDLTIPSSVARSTGTGIAGSAVIRRQGRTAATAVVLRAERAGRRRLLRQVPLAAGRRSGATVVTFRASVTNLAATRYRLVVCVDPGRRVRESRENNNCRVVGTLVVSRRKRATVIPPPPPRPKPRPALKPAPAPAPAPGAGDQPLPPPCPTPACAPAAIPAREQPFTINDALGRYWAFVPTDYDPAKPTRLLVWLHGCGGESAGDLFVVGDYYDDQNYVAIAPDGAEDGCWSMGTGPRRVLTAIADAGARFHIDARRIVIGGYSSGGDLAYRTAFYNARTFAGVLAINTSPFRDTGSTAAASIAAAAWRFPVVHVAHTADDTYPIGGVTGETQALTNAGFPVTFVQRAGHHYDPNPGEDGYVAGQPSTDQEVQSLLVPHMKDDWTSPAP